MRDKLYRYLTKLISKRYNLVVGVGAILTIIMVIISTNLSINNRISDMLPDDIPLIKSFNKLIKDFNSDTVVMIGVESDGKDQKLMEEVADKLAKNLRDITYTKPNEEQELTFSQQLQLTFGEGVVEGVKYDSIPMVKRIDYRADTEFFKNHGFIVQKRKDFKNSISIYEDLSFDKLLKGLNDNFEKEFVDDSDNLASLDGEQKAIAGLENCYNFISTIAKNDINKLGYNESVNKFLLGDQYFYSSDKSMLLLSLVPAIPSDDFDLLMEMAALVRDEANKVMEDYPDIKLSFAGTPFLVLEENEALLDDFGVLTFAALLLVFIILVGSFRSWRNPFNSVLSLVISIIMVSGLLAIILKYITIMSASFGIILVGLGIDFAIHFLSGFKEGVEKGYGVEKSLEFMYSRVGNGVIVGAITTAFVFLSLIFSDFKALTEMGITMAVGIITTLGVMLTILPALMVKDHLGDSWVKRFLNGIGLRVVVDTVESLGKFISPIFNNPLTKLIGDLFQFRFMNSLGRFSENRGYSYSVLFISITISILAYLQFSNLSFEYNMMELEPEGMQSTIAQDKILDKFQISPDFAMFTTDSIALCREKVEALKKMGNKTGIIGRVDAVTELFTDRESQERNREDLKKFKEVLISQQLPEGLNSERLNSIADELERLHFNIVEIGELSVMSNGENNKVIRKCDQIVGKSDEDSKLLKLSEMVRSGELDGEMIEKFESGYFPFLKETLLSMANEEYVDLNNLPESIKRRYTNKRNDNLLVTVYPKSNIWEERNLRSFQEGVVSVDDSITGMPLITFIFIELTKQKGKLSTILGFIVIFVILMIDFKNVKYTLLATIPLIFGALWMVGAMGYLGIKINYNNIMVLPIILGIGIDDGVHILHRFKAEGRRGVKVVIESTGKAILLTSLTTMIGFGSLAVTTHRGMASMGYVLTIGVFTCFISSVFVLPALLNIFSNKNRSLYIKSSNENVSINSENFTQPF